MPLPDEAIDVNGGCNCGAIRYRLVIPAKNDRPLHPLAPADAPIPLPFLVIDHCNDCRRATGALLPIWICAPIEMATMSLVQSKTGTLAPKAADRKDRAAEQRDPWIPAVDVFIPNSDDTPENYFLRSYESSHERWRWFCSRCGTNIAYTAVMPEGFPNMLDITMGSVDRQDLESNALLPERHLWWDYGIDWIRHLATKGYGTLPIHPDYRVTETVDL